MPQKKTYQIEVFRVDSSPVWYFAVSAELPEFVAHGPTIGVLRDRVRDTFIEILSKDRMVLKVQVTPLNRGRLPEEITTHTLIPAGAVPYRSAIAVHTEYEIAA